MFDMRSLTDQAPGQPALNECERHAVALISEGASPREVADRLAMEEVHVYRLVVDVLDYVEPPGGPTIADYYEVRGIRPATTDEIGEFERLYGASLAPDDEG